MLALLTVFLTLEYGLFYAMFSVVPTIMEGYHGFNAGQTGLTFIALGLGSLFASFANLWHCRHYKDITPMWKGITPPEERLWGAMVGGPVFVISIFWLAFTGNYPDVPCELSLCLREQQQLTTGVGPAPMVALLLFGYGLTACYVSVMSFIVDSYLFFAASGLAANMVCRSVGGAVLPFLSVPWFNNMGIQVGPLLIFQM